ncbi:unnamed protein product [Protopolystoma xenopodis]|uniref:Uncharacterized protein n=1 Tax=Protopolystoma xenopodis TaxID=117903 RepID=A0A3S5BMX4_9PLAT|nr:unnamed protein product [Protopolystoma xenopodis]
MATGAPMPRPPPLPSSATTPTPPTPPVGNICGTSLAGTNLCGRSIINQNGNDLAMHGQVTSPLGHPNNAFQLLPWQLPSGFPNPPPSSGSLSPPLLSAGMITSPHANCLSTTSLSASLPPWSPHLPTSGLLPSPNTTHPFLHTGLLPWHLNSLPPPHALQFPGPGASLTSTPSGLPFSSPPDTIVQPPTDLLIASSSTISSPQSELTTTEVRPDCPSQRIIQAPLSCPQPVSSRSQHISLSPDSLVGLDVALPPTELSCWALTRALRLSGLGREAAANAALLLDTANRGFFPRVANDSSFVTSGLEAVGAMEDLEILARTGPRDRHELRQSSRLCKDVTVANALIASPIASTLSNLEVKYGNKAVFNSNTSDDSNSSITEQANAKATADLMAEPDNEDDAYSEGYEERENSTEVISLEEDDRQNHHGNNGSGDIEDYVITTCPSRSLQEDLHTSETTALSKKAGLDRCTQRDKEVFCSSEAGAKSGTWASSGDEGILTCTMLPGRIQAIQTTTNSFPSHRPPLTATCL